MGKDKMLSLGLIVALIVTLLFMGGCVPAGEPGEPTGGFDWTIIIFLVLIFGLFYLVLIRPQRKRQKQHQQLVEELKRGDRIITAGGIHGVIESVSEDSILMRVESGATMRVAKSSVALKQDTEKLYTR